MTKVIGRDYKIGIGLEGSALRGTPADPQFWVPHRAFDFDDKSLLITDDQGYGVIEKSVDVQVVKKWAEGSLEATVRDKTLGVLLLNILGAVSTDAATPEAGVYTHTFTVQQGNQHPSITISIDDPVVGDRAYALGMIQNLELRAELEEFVVFNAGLISKKAASGCSLTPAYTAENSFAANDMNIYFAATQALLSAASATKIKSTAIRFNPDVEKDDILGSLDPNDIHNRSLSIEIEVTKDYIDSTYRDYYRDATGRAMRLELEDTSVTIGTETHPKCTIDLNQVKITDWSKATDLDGIVKETFTMMANFKIADSKMVGITLINTHESYLGGLGGGEVGARATIAAA